MAEFWYKPKTVSLVFEPLLADMQHEWMRAHGRGQRIKAVWVRIRGYGEFLSACGLQGIVSLVRKIARLWKLA